MNVMIITSIIMAMAFWLILFINTKRQNKIVHVAFQIFIFLFLMLLIIFDNNYVLELLKSSITYFTYPSYLLYISTVIITNVIMLYTFVKRDLDIKNKILNYTLFVIIFIAYISFNSLGIDSSLYNSLYTSYSLIFLRLTTITFSLWFVITIGIKYIRILFKKG